MEADQAALRIGPAREADREALAALLVETVAANGSVGFMHPLAAADAAAFWDGALQSAARGERIVLCAWRGQQLLGTGSLLLQVLGGSVREVNVGIEELSFGDVSGSATLSATGVPLDETRPVGSLDIEATDREHARLVGDQLDHGRAPLGVGRRGDDPGRLQNR